MKKITYAESGVNISAGEKASKAAYANAKKTFSSRKGLIGQPFELDGGFAGALDFGDFLLIQNDDGVGTKSEIAERLNKFDTIGEDLLCTVADDAICVGAEVISMTNTLDVPSVNPIIIEKMTDSLAQACRGQKIVIPGGEIAEVGKACNKMVWNATAVGIVKKEKFITGKEVKAGQKIIGLQGRVFRSNGISLARKICELNFGENWHKTIWKDKTTWGEILLTPSKIFHRLLLENILGDFETPCNFNISGLVHITGGGIPGNVPRILPKGLGANFDNLHTPHQALQDLKKLGNVDDEECYKTWHCGTALLLICDEKDGEEICHVLNKSDSEVNAKIVGSITNSAKINLNSGFSEKTLEFPISH